MFAVDSPAAMRPSFGGSCQGFKTVDMFLHDGRSWDRAIHLEVLPDTKRPLTNTDEEEMVARKMRNK